MKKRIKEITGYLLTIAIVIVSLWLAAKDINFTKFWNILTDADYLYILLPVPVIILSHWIRAVRWKTMLGPALKKKSPSLSYLFSAVMIGYAVNCVITRLGEFFRPYVYARREKVPYSTVLATIVVERFIDLFVVIFMFLIALLFSGDKLLNIFPETDTKAIIIIAAAFLLILLISFYPPFFRIMLKKIIKPISEKLYEKLNELYIKFHNGFAVLKTKSRYFKLSLESAEIWLLYSLSLYIMFFAFDFQNELKLGFMAAIILIAISGMGVAIAPSPGAIGVYHLVVSNILVNLYGVHKEEALAFATIAHLVNYIIQLGLGGIYFLKENIKNVKEITRETEEKSIQQL